MTLPSSVTVSPEVMSRQVATETVLLDLASGTYYGLDGVGTRIWHLLGEGQTPAQVLDTLRQEYEAGEEQLEADIARLLGALRDRGLITIP
jgi:hypothetical protein